MKIPDMVLKMRLHVATASQVLELLPEDRPITPQEADRVAVELRGANALANELQQTVKRLSLPNYLRTP